MNIGIYLLRNEIDGKIYVGQSSKYMKWKIKGFQL